MKLLLSVLSVVLVGCGADLRRYNNFPVPSDVQPYVLLFQQQVGHPVTNIQYQFGSLGYTDAAGGVIGQCQLPDGIVTLDQTFWDESDATDRELLVMHELGHCVLFRAHLNTDQANGYDTSIMNAYIMPESEFQAEPSYFLGELTNVNGVPMIYGSNSTGESVHRCSRPGKGS